MNTNIHDCSFFWIDTGTSIKGGGVKGVIWGNSSPLREMMLSFTGEWVIYKLLKYNWVRNVEIKNGEYTQI